MVPFENLLGECDHFLNWDVELAADSFEDSVDDMKVDDQNVPIDSCFYFKTFVFAKEGEEKIS